MQVHKLHWEPATLALLVITGLVVSYVLRPVCANVLSFLLQ